MNTCKRNAHLDFTVLHPDADRSKAKLFASDVSREIESLLRKLYKTDSNWGCWVEKCNVCSIFEGTRWGGYHVGCECPVEIIKARQEIHLILSCSQIKYTELLNLLKNNPCSPLVISAEAMLKENNPKRRKPILGRSYAHTGPIPCYLQNEVENFNRIRNFCQDIFSCCTFMQRLMEGFVAKSNFDPSSLFADKQWKHAVKVLSFDASIPEKHQDFMATIPPAAKKAMMKIRRKFNYELNNLEYNERRSA